MRITWALADQTMLDPVIEIEQLKNIGPLWGGWKTWRSYITDNVVCYRESDARQLINKQFHTRCNFYIPNSIFQSVGRPDGVTLYQGQFNEIIDNPDEIVAMHLSATNSDIVLLLGFDLTPRNLDHDRLAKHKWHNYIQYFLSVINENPRVQWILVDHPADIDKQLKKVPNLQFDTLTNILEFKG